MRVLIAAFALFAAGCVSQTSTETRLVTDSGGADPRRRAEIHTALAAEYYARGNFTVALEETRRALKDDETYFPAHNMQGLVFMELREDASAREAFDRALRLSPNNAEVLNNFGWFLCLRRMGRLEEAEQHLRRAVLIQPNLIGGLYNLAEITFERGKAKDAENYIMRYMRLTQPTLEALVLAVKIARANGDKVVADSLMQQLRRRFGDAPQLRELEASK